MADTLFPNVIVVAGFEPAYAQQLLGLETAGNEVETAADRHYIVNDGRTMLLVYNSTGAPIDITFTGAADSKGRVPSTAQLTEAIAAGTYAALGPFPLDGWNDANNRIYFVASAVGLRCAALRLLKG